ncbi:DUF885 domain-containing protein [Leucobacter sp. M11]|uniref:DUF885 domain-containing protein n=1 Tax=Leucobacter sp. M11 TaxID=2993565 RepID=UPI002D7F093C|nr:DUF885 domain-containing protein [Leucobacter sp. M11]MEB4613614.1 DUF885 domain-containing protein [Leucobacter sp. M11]
MSAPSQPAPARVPTPIDAIAERWVDTVARLRPTKGTYIGHPGSNHRLGDLSPEGLAEEETEARRSLAELSAAPPQDAVDAVTQRALGDQLRLLIEQSEAGLPLRNLNVIESPLQEIRDSFDLMPRQTEADWADTVSRLNAVEDALAGYRESLRAGVRAGNPPARRQALVVGAQAARHGADTGFFRALAAGATGLGPAQHAALTAAADRAARAYADTADFLRTELAPAAPERDGVGREHYALASRGFLGATVDLDESYEWGLAEVARMAAEQERIAREIVPGGGVPEAIAALDADPARVLHGTEALQRWMQDTSDRAVAELGATHFDIPEPLRRLDCRIAPTQEGGIYYSQPSDDFSRPGQMWWSVPPGVTEFTTWRELTTVYHEGVPGHHLQIGSGVLNRGTLNAWRRQLAGTAGHEEGWALYAERLMAELGYLADPGDRFGMLDGQRMRAARVVIDLGVHLGKQRPDGGGVWDAEAAFAFLREHVTMDPAFVEFEVNRYLGWPGQAPAYKIGQRRWEQLREAAAVRAGADFDIREFHREALSLGTVGLDTLAWALDGGAAAAVASGGGR